MAQKPGDVVQGTLEMLILKTLALQPMHGYAGVWRCASSEVSDGVRFESIPARCCLLRCCVRMERAGSVKSEWRSTENNRRAKYYMLTAAGRKALEDETNAWGRQTAAISRILQA